MTAVLRKYPLGAAFVAILAILALLPQPWKGRLATHGLVHVCAHVAAFSAAFFLNTWRQRDWTIVNLTAALLLLFALLLEALQTRVYGNIFEYRDVVADATGIVLGLLVRKIWET